MRARDLETPFHGVRVPAAGAGCIEDLCRAYAAHLRPGDFFSHTTAALLWGCPLPRGYDRLVHVTSRAPRRAAEGIDITGHRVADPRIRVVVRHGLPVTDPATTWCDLAMCRTSVGRDGQIRGLDDLVAAGDHLVLTPRYPRAADPRPFVPRADLVERCAAYSRRGKRVAGAAIVLVRDGAESRPETLVRLALLRRGMPELLLNRDVFDHLGVFAGRADMVYPEQRIIVEYDGEQHRLDDEQYAKDERRIEDLRSADYAILRIRKNGLRDLRGATDRVEHALRRAGWQRPR